MSNGHRGKSKEIKCPFCDFTKKQEKTLFKHVQLAHDKNLDEQLYIEIILNGDTEKVLCSCGCGSRRKWHSWRQGYPSKYLRGHNASDDSIFNDADFSKVMALKRHEGYQSGLYSVWNKGLSNETDSRVSSMHKKAGATRKLHVANGTVIPWQNTCSPDIRSNWIAKVKGSSRLPFSEVRERVSKLAEFVLVSDESDYLTRQHSHLKLLCKKCGEIQLSTLKNAEDTPRCYSCHPRESYDQIEIGKFIESLGFEIRHSARDLISPKEIDIYVPGTSFALEYNGLSFHTENDVENDYHYSKTLSCQKINLNLFHVFSDEWRSEKRKIIEGMIRTRLGKPACRLHARKLTHMDVSPTNRKIFFDSCHLDGDVKSTKSFGLVDADRHLVCVLSLRKPRQKKYSDCIEIARFASIPGFIIPGALSKLMTKVRTWSKESGFKRILTYADLRLGTGESYVKVGFKDIGKTVNRFWWTDKSKRYDRFLFRADSSRGMTEKQVATEAGVFRIYGCPNRTFIMDL